MTADPFAELGAFLTGSEAAALAAQFSVGTHVVNALGEISTGRRPAAKSLLRSAGLDHTDAETATAVLSAIAGAKSVHRDLMPVWTMPGDNANTCHLTSEFHRLVDDARQSVTCATYNFDPTSQMWTAVRDASNKPDVAVTAYVDGTVAGGRAVREQLPNATLYCSGELDSGDQIVSHAKFVIIDHRMLLLASANFSYSAENTNIELGLLIDDSALAESVEHTMVSKHGTLYELVQ